MSVSVVLSTYQRGHLLERSLRGYARQKLDVPFQLVVIDDGSTDGTDRLCREWAEHLDLLYIRTPKQPGVWRDCAATLNIGIRAARGKLVIGTHPEVIPGVRSLQHLWEGRQEKAYLACKVYYLTVDNQQHLDTVPWIDSNLAVRHLPGFYRGESPEVRQHDDYSHEATDRHTTWGSFVFGGMTRESWRWFGGFREFNQWGAIDVDFLNRRNILEMLTLTALDPETIVIHQNHDVAVKETDVITDRNMDRALDVPIYERPEDALLNNI